MRVIYTLGMLMLAACAALEPQQPVAEQDPFAHKQMRARYGEDRITLRLKPDQSHITSEQQEYIANFASYYKEAKDTGFFVSLLLPPEMEDKGRLPDHSPSVKAAIASVIGTLQGMNINPRVITEIDTHQDPMNLEARAWKSIIDTSKTTPNSHEDFSRIAPAPEQLVRDIKIAVIAREYDVEATNCPSYGRFGWNNRSVVGNRILTGCAITKNTIAQVKNKASLVHGEPMDGTYDSSFDISRLRQHQGGTYAPDVSATLDNGGSGGASSTQ
jgi:type IV pilus biogenesis protein CpaD/CtpE